MRDLRPRAGSVGLLSVAAAALLLATAPVPAGAASAAGGPQVAPYLDVAGPNRHNLPMPSMWG